jgi:hypothetical protein
VTTAGYATALCGPWLSQIYEAYRVRCGKARLSWHEQNDQGAKWGAPLTSTRRAGTCHKRAWVRVAVNRNAKLGFYFGYDLSTLKKLHERRAPAVRKRIYPVLPVVLDESPDGHGPHRARMPRAP